MADVNTVKHLIVGAGFAGLGTAIKLQEDGESDFVVIEKGSDVGGTWRDNTYPGATCDIPSQLYSYSFAEFDWSSSYSPQPEIQAYIKQVADESGTLDRFVFDTLVEDAAWDDEAQRWQVRTSNGSRSAQWSAQFLIVGAGGLSAPKLPDIEGIDTFQGDVFHSARWNHDVDLTGKRVAVIGTGASAIQIVPELQQTLQATGGHLDVYQRTAPWIIPRNDRPYGRLERAALRRVPGLQRLYRTGLYWAHEAYVPAFTLQPKLAAPARKVALGNIRKGIKDPELRAKVTPNFDFGCKRVLRSNDYYPALDADNTELVTDPIAKVTGQRDRHRRRYRARDRRPGRGDRLLHDRAPDHRARDRPLGTDACGALAGDRHGRLQGHHHPRLPQPVPAGRPEHRPGAHEHDLHHRVAGRLRARRDPDDERTAAREHRADPGGHRRLEPQPAEADGPHRVDHRRLPELVPRRPRPQHHAVAQVHRRLPAPAGVVRRRGLPGGARVKTLDDKVVVITGAGSGIGRALALNLARRGSLLALSDVDEAGLAETVAQATRAGAIRVRSDRLDVADRDAFARYALDMVQEFGRVNVVINNAGVALAGDFNDLEYTDIDWLVGVNFWGVVHGTKEFLPHLIASGDGHVVNLSSLFGLVSMPGQSMYNATKYAVRGMTEALREEMLIAGHPVGVTAVHPGGIKTAIARNARVSAKESKEATAQLFDEKLARMTPERAAEIIVNGILKNRARVLVGIDAHAMHHLAKLLGSRYQDVVAKTSKRVLPDKATVV